MSDLKSYAEKRIQQVKQEGQETFGSPDIEHLEPLLKELIDGKAQGYIIAVEFKDGIVMKVKSKPSKKLIEDTIEYLGD